MTFSSPFLHLRKYQPIGLSATPLFIFSSHFQIKLKQPFFRCIKREKKKEEVYMFPAKRKRDGGTCKFFLPGNHKNRKILLYPLPYYNLYKCYKTRYNRKFIKRVENCINCKNGCFYI